MAGFVMANACFAAGGLIVVVKAEGGVTTSDSSGKNERAVASKSVLPQKQVLVTGENGRAVVRVGDSGYLVVEKNSKVEISSSKDLVGFFRHVTGMIYYAFNVIKGDRPKLVIKMSNANLGIRGTRFLIADMPDRNEIVMRKGLISVSSPDEEFEIHRNAELDEFEAFKQEGIGVVAKEKREFDEYKADSKREFVEYKREFSLGENRMASFDGKRVQERPLNEVAKRDMETLEEYAEEWLKEVRD